MSDTVKFFMQLKKQIKSETYVAVLATVTRIHLNGRIDARPSNLPLLVHMRKVRGTYQVGDTVLVVFLDGDGQHSLSDGLVVGVVD
jgi:hypothetical protein